MLILVQDTFPLTAGHLLSRLLSIDHLLLDNPIVVVADLPITIFALILFLAQHRIVPVLTARLLLRYSSIGPHSLLLITLFSRHSSISRHDLLLIVLFSGYHSSKDWNDQ